MADGLIEVSRLGVLTLGGNATLEATAAYIKQPGQTLTQLQSVPYDQYEVGGLEWQGFAGRGEEGKEGRGEAHECWHS
jgi:hypothetical protein